MSAAFHSTEFARSKKVGQLISTLFLLAAILGACGCKTFDYSEDDLARERELMKKGSTDERFKTPDSYR